MIKFTNVKFEDQVNVSLDTEFDGCEFAAQGNAVKDSKFGVEVKGNAALTVKNSTFNNKGYSSVHMLSNGDVLLENNKFNCANVYNPVEGAVSGGATNDIVMRNCEFEGKCGNNYFNLYTMEDGAEVLLEGNKFNGVSVDSEIIRISNPANVNAHIVAKDEHYNFAAGVPTQYTAYIMCQDYTAKNGNKQDFSLISIDVDNVKCNGEKIVKVPACGALAFTYEDGKGIITDNNPVITIK